MYPFQEKRGGVLSMKIQLEQKNLMRIFPGEQGRVHNPVHGRSGKQVM